ncbi:MAG: ABC transporter permease [Lachnospiraceae bacterium]
MSLRDLLRMSCSNLKRRKLRTFLTVLGVVIGTASVVLMISLGLGMQQSLYKEVEQSGGLTSIQVSAQNTSTGGMGMAQEVSDTKKETQYITEDVIKTLQKLEHVKLAAPVLMIPCLLLKGNYIGNVELTGMNHETLKAQKIPLVKGGSLPRIRGGALDLVVGNGVITSFYNKNTNKGYWDEGEVPKIDFKKDQLFLILDSDAYNATQEKSGEPGMGTAENGGQQGEKNQKPMAPPKKHVVRASGVVTGDIQTYTPNFNSVFCDLDMLMLTLKKEFAGRTIPGQPTTKAGKPYKHIIYSLAKVTVDNIDEVEDVSNTIRNMGYEVTSNIEYLNSVKKQFAIIQAVLGGIGAVSLFVAAIGIANTMMMSIYERTKEIGVIKVLGCGLKNIKQMFLLEAAFIGFLGGVIGNILSLLASLAINAIVGTAGASMGFSGGISHIPAWLVLTSLGFAVLVGMVAGYFPALRAMRLSPLAAIRNE